MLRLNLYFLWLPKKLMTALHFLEVEDMCLSHKPGNFYTLLFVTPGEGLNPSAQNLKFSRFSFATAKVVSR